MPSSGHVLQAFELGGGRINSLGAPVLAKQANPITSDSLRAQLEPNLKKTKTIQILEATRPLFGRIYDKKKKIFMDNTPLVGLVFYLVLVVPGFDRNRSGIPDFRHSRTIFVRGVNQLPEFLKAVGTAAISDIEPLRYVFQRDTVYDWGRRRHGVLRSLKSHRSASPSRLLPPSLATGCKIPRRLTQTTA